MSKTGKYVSLCLIMSALSLALMIGPAFSQNQSNLSIPVFSVKFVDRSYVVAPTFTMDPYTGETRLSGVGGQVENKTLDFKINHQDFSPYQSERGPTVDLYFEIRYKGQFEDWTHYGGSRVYASKSSDTLKTIKVGADGDWWTISNGGTVDIQVRAVTGYGGYGDQPFTQISTGEWSNTQSITIPSTFASTSPYNPSPTESLPNSDPTSSPSPVGFSNETIVAIAVSAAIISTIFAVSLLLYVRHLQRKIKTMPS